ncbi:inosine/xanthosine triphosphatase [Candidatus Gracilibacteria bacterium]|nr:inosine/xanthosine triphosphatase [Candidatus Gracilibacteria bacterium]
MIKVIVASTNPVKIAATKLGFERMFPDQLFSFEGVSTISGVNDQPWDETETFTGAYNRANNAFATHNDATYWVGLESGIADFQGETLAFGWIVIRNQEGMYGKGRTAGFILPHAVTSLMKEGKELGEADDIVFGRSNSAKANGAIGLLTGDVITRTAYMTEAVITALIPFKNPKLYF